MEPGLARFESEQPKVKYIHVNIDEREQPENKELMDNYFEGRSIPLTVAVAPDGEAKAKWTGAKTYEELVNEMAALEKDSK